jgi:coiled-coil domain-containing protein 61
MVEKSAEMHFHGIDYVVTVRADPSMLHVAAEQKYDGELWQNSFPAQYIEEITQKTGNSKKFPVFVKMLLTSLESKSDSVFVDILTRHDLEMLK